MQRKIFNIIKVSAVYLLFYSCANIGSPVGGPKDVSPPKVIDTDPADNSINFGGQKNITITFDEFIVLKDIYQEMIISPPLEENVNPYLKNKNLVIEFPEVVVFDTTTYTLSFGNSITDNNEGNVLSNYEFVFSLKSYIDSLSVEGKVVNSFDLKTDEDRMYVMLYKNLADSAPFKEKPKYICRANKEGNFSIHNLEPGFYRIFALKDANSNLLYDIPDEQIAFGDSIIELSAEKLGIDTITNEVMASPAKIEKIAPSENEFKLTATPVNDTISNDSTVKIRKYVFDQELRFFTPNVKNQYITNNVRQKMELLFFTFNQSLADSFRISPLKIQYSDIWYIADINETYDSLKYWLTDTTMINKDSLQFEVNYPVYDSLGGVITKSDTLLMLFHPKEKPEPTGRKSRQKDKNQSDSIPAKIKKLSIANNITNPSAFDLDRSLNFNLSTPLKEVRKEKIKMSRFEDTLEIALKPVINEGNTLYNFNINFSPIENTSYTVLIPDSTVFDIYGTTNDTTILTFKTQSEDFYAALTMNMNNIDIPVILQLMDEKEKLVRENKISESQPVKYNYLVPKKYLLKLIIDSNNNGKWDPGNYLLKLQPEKVIYYPQFINVRSNWEIELTWDFQK